MGWFEQEVGFDGLVNRHFATNFATYVSNQLRVTSKLSPKRNSKFKKLCGDTFIRRLPPSPSPERHSRH